MKTSINILLFIIVVISSSNQINAQLSERLKGITKFKEIQSITEQYYAELKEEGKERHHSDPKYKHWKRWEYDLRLELMPNGEVAQNKNLLINANKSVQKVEESQDRSTISYWTYDGPDGLQEDPTSTHFIGLGRVNRMAFHPTDENTIYIGGPSGGIWKTTDAGSNWTALDDYLPSLGISGIVVSHENPNVVYALSGDGDGGGYGFSSGVFKSTDGGESWKVGGQLADETYSGYRLEMDPNNADRLFAATNKGLYQTIDGGNSWTKSLSGLVYDVKFKPGSSSPIYAALPSTIARSFSGNLGSWFASSLTPAPDSIGRVALAVTPADPERVYAFIGPKIDNSTYEGFYYSNNSGLSFLRVHNSPNMAGPQSNYDFCATASPTNANTVLVGGLIVYKSTNGGSFFSAKTGYGYLDELDWYVHHDIHDIEINPLNGNLYAATDGGFYVSDNVGDSWTDLSVGLGLAQYYRIDITTEDDNYVVGGLQDNGIKLKKNTSVIFDHIQGADGFDTKFYNGDKSKFYATTNGSTKRFWDNGSSQANFNMPGNLWFNKLAIKPDDNNTVLIGTDDNGGRLYKSTNQGDNVTFVDVPCSAAIESCPSYDDLVYFAGPQSMYRSINFGDTYETISSNPGFPTDFPQIADIGVHPNQANVVYVSMGGYGSPTGIYKSTTFGNTWTDFTGSLPQIPIRCIAVHSNGDVYVGTNIGVFYRPLGASDWVPFRNGLPNVVINDLVIQPNTNRLYAGTYGRGIWSAPIGDGNCLENLTFLSSSTFEGYYFYEVNNNVSCRSTIEGEETTELIIHAGNRIDLLPDFRATHGGNFRAIIAPCGNGVPQVIGSDPENSGND